MTDIAEELALSRKHARRSGILLVAFCVAVAAVIVLAVHEGLWPPPDRSPAGQISTPG